MRVYEFTKWLAYWPTTSGGELTLAAINFFIKAIEDIEKAENIDMDEEFEKDGMTWISELYSYSIDDHRFSRPNPTNLKIKICSGNHSPYEVLVDYKTALNHYRKFSICAGDAPNADNYDATFRLECELQDIIRENITRLDPSLEIIDNGFEREVVTGKIDILAKDGNDCLVIIELKAGRAYDPVIAQTLGYMSDIAYEKDAQVRGIIVAGDFNKRVLNASQVIPNLDLRGYGYTFNLRKNDKP